MRDVSDDEKGNPENRSIPILWVKYPLFPSSNYTTGDSHDNGRTAAKLEDR
jgi:hypothetical protein